MLKTKFTLALTLVIVMSLLAGGATFALFSDHVDLLDTDLMTAATLSLTSERDQGDRVPGPMFYVTAAQGATTAPNGPVPAGTPGLFPTNLWAPGDSHVRTLTVYNPVSSSTLDAWLDSAQATIRSGEPAMAGKLWVEISTPDINNVYVKVAEGWLTEFLSGPVSMRFPGGSQIPCVLTGNRQLQFKVTFDASAGNDLQGDTVVVDFSVNGVQMVHNP
ncbi:MAG: hypothetical protein ACOY46_08290 [Bacillota bacterium]